MKALRHITVLTALIAVLTLTSCHSTRHAATTPVAVNGPVDTWTNVYMPVKVTVSGTSEASLNGRATVIRNSCIHLSMRYIGMEVAVLHINTDSVFFVDKYHKYMFAEPLSSVTGSNFADLGMTRMQRIAFGQTPFVNGRLTVAATDFAPTPAGDIAQAVSFGIELPTDTVKTYVHWDTDAATWNDPGRSVKFRRPKGYNRITVQDAEAMLKSLNFR